MVKSWDRRLARTAEKLIAADKSDQALETVFKRSCPQIHRQIVEDGRHPKLLDLWGKSHNFDEHARRRIVHPSILRLIGDLANVEMDAGAVHAGLQHTYGYLFSLITTPYGFKRERWVETGLENALGIHPDALGPSPRRGTLLSNLTYLLGRIAFSGREKELAILRRHREFIDQDLLDVPYRRFQRRRVQEQFSAPLARRKRRVTIRTDLVSLPNMSDKPECANTLLVYWVLDEANPTAQIITAFTIPESMADQLLNQPTGRRVKIRVRYNAFVEGANEATFVGTRI